MTVPRRGPAFTLIEILVALGILGLAVTGVLAIFVAAAASHVRAVRGTDAALIATSAVADARAAFRTGSRPAPARDSRLPGKPVYSYDTDYIPLDREGDEALMLVTVRWLDRGVGRTARFETILLRKADQ